jgi:hypothetical protein
VRIFLIIAGTVAAAFAVGVIGLVFFSTHGTEPTAAAPGPQLSLKGKSFDLGEVPADVVVERAVDFRNSGQEPLDVSIVKVRPAPDAACGCGVEDFEVSPATVAPNQAGQLIFKLKVPAGMADMEDKMVAELQTNDPARPTVKISIIFRMAS